MSDTDDTYDDTYDDADDDDFNRIDPSDEGDDDEGGSDPNQVTGAGASAVLEYIARSVVDNPDEVRIDAEESGQDRVSLEVRVADGDMGRVIGKRGRVANAIRTVVRAAASQDGVDVDVEFVD